MQHDRAGLALQGRQIACEQAAVIQGGGPQAQGVLQRLVVVMLFWQHAQPALGFELLLGFSDARGGELLPEYRAAYGQHDKRQ
ncbi:hypothetical protein D3C76_1153370 [compost metagenome]